MSDIPFHTTQMGHRFFLRDVPALVAALERLDTTCARIAAALERLAAEAQAPADGES
jgi:hypothetical protein